MIATRVLVFPSMPKGEIGYKWLSMMPTQATQGLTPIFDDKFDMEIHGISC